MMDDVKDHSWTEFWKEKYPEKFVPASKIFSKIHRGDKIFISTGCGEPQHLISALTDYIDSNPKAFAEAEVMHVWSLGVAPYTDEKFNYNFRHNSFFVGDSTRDSINTGLADYTPISLSDIPKLMRSGRIEIDVAMIQVSRPDKNGLVSLGISVDITRSALDNADIIIAQINNNMPRIHGDTFIDIKKIDFIIPHDEDLLEYAPNISNEVAQEIGRYVGSIIKDGDCIQLGYGSLPNAILHNLKDKKHLGVHTELLTDSMIELIKDGTINNSRKTLNRGKTVASFCMGSKETYEYLDDNPLIEFRPIDYTNNPINIGRINNMTAINSALQVDLTGQSTSESVGSSFYSGIGGHADFMRGAILAPNGKTILVIQSTARNGEVSRIVPFLDSGAGVTLNRGDIRYVVTEYGIAYIHGKNIRERAMDLIAIAHPKFRPWLIEEAKKLKLIYQDQAFIPGKKGEYPEHLETLRTTKSGLQIQMRPVKINDEPLIKDFFYALSDKSLQRRFMSIRLDIPHKMRQEMVVIDYTHEMTILAVAKEKDQDVITGMGQIIKDESSHTAEVAFAVRDDYHNNGIGTILIQYLTILAKRDGLLGFTADVLVENKPMMHVFEKTFSDLHKRIEDNVYELTMRFSETPDQGQQG